MDRPTLQSLDYRPLTNQSGGAVGGSNQDVPIFDRLYSHCILTNENIVIADPEGIF